MSNNAADTPKGYTPPKDRPTPRRGQEKAQAVRRANRRAQIQWAAVVVAIIAISGLLLLIGGDGAANGFGIGGHSG